jgi:predicted RNase H-like nuclease (RuvC/YqgF family)
MSRTDKIKDKNKQIKVFTDEMSKMNQKVEELSKMAEQLMEENDTLKHNITSLETKNEQFRQFYSQLGRIKGEINSKKSSEFAKLTESLEKLAKLNYI